MSYVIYTVVYHRLIHDGFRKYLELFGQGTLQTDDKLNKSDINLF